MKIPWPRRATQYTTVHINFSGRIPVDAKLRRKTKLEKPSLFYEDQKYIEQR